MSVSQKLIQNFAKPAVVGLAAKLIAMGMNVDSTIGEADIALIDTSISASNFFALLGVGSSLVSSTAEQWVLPMLPKNSPQLVQMEGAALGPALNGLSNVIFIKYFYPGFESAGSLMQPFLIGAASEVLGGYAYDNFVEQWVRKYM